MHKALFGCISFLLLINVTQAQVVEQLSPLERKQLTRVTEPLTLYKGFLRAGLSTQFISGDKNFDEHGNKVALESNVSSNILIHSALIQYGITDRLEVEFTIPFAQGTINSSYTVEAPFFNTFDEEQYTVKYAGLIDPTVNLRYQLIQGSDTQLGLSIGPALTLPLGKKDLTDYKDDQNYQPPVAKGEFGIGGEMTLRKIAYPFSFDLGILYQSFLGADKILSPEEPAVRVKSGSEIVIRPAMSFHLNDWVLLTHYIDYYNASKDSFVGEDRYGSHNNEFNQYQIRYYPGLSFQLSRFRLEQTIMFPITGKVMSADTSFYLKLQYVF